MKIFKANSLRNQHITKKLKGMNKDEIGTMVDEARSHMTNIIIVGICGLVAMIAGFNLMVHTVTFDGTTQYLPNIFGVVAFIGAVAIFIYTQESKRFRKTDMFWEFRHLHVDYGFLITDVAIMLIVGAQLAYLFL